MEFHVRLSPRALRDAESAYLYYADINPEYAVAWYNGLETTLETLAQFPLRCSLAYESRFFDVELRQLLYGRKARAYRILFTVHGDEVRVHHIRHCRQKPLAGPFPSDDE